MEPSTIAFLAAGFSLIVGMGLIGFFVIFDNPEDQPSRDSAPYNKR